MRVYVESNFVLELVLEQEQHDACEEILALAKDGHVDLAIPAIAIVEPVVKIERDNVQRRELQQSLGKAIAEIGRSRSFSDAMAANPVAELLVRSSEYAGERYDSVTTRLLSIARILPLDAQSMRRAEANRSVYGLKRFDSIVLGAVLEDLAREARPSCFPNRDTDFDDPAIHDELQALGCKVIGGFVNGLGFMKSQLSH